MAAIRAGPLRCLGGCLSRAWPCPEVGRAPLFAALLVDLAKREEEPELHGAPRHRTCTAWTCRTTCTWTSLLSGEVILQIANEPVLPFNALDIALEVQNRLKGNHPSAQHLLAMASRLRESAELFQSDEMRPANDPKERAPVRVRMLSDVLQDMEKSFLVQQVPPGFYRNILYHTDEKTSQFSILMEAWEHSKSLASHETLQEALSDV